MRTRQLTLTTPTDREITMTRIFDAPRELVFEALTDPEMLKQWFSGPPGWSLVVCEIDLRVGGHYRYVWHCVDGSVLSMRGVYTEVVAGKRIVSTELFDDPWHPGGAVGTIKLDERNGKTRLTNTMRYSSQTARDRVLRTSMKEGVSMGYDRLAELAVPALALI